MTAPPPPTLSPDARAATRAAARWRTVALSLAVVSAFLTGLLLLSLGADSASKDADAGAKDAAQENADTDNADAVKRGRIEGAVMLSGTPPYMPVPWQRKTHAYCKSKPLPSNAVRVKDRRLQDVLVRIENGGVKGAVAPPDIAAALDHDRCLLAPRIQGAMVGQELALLNRDPVPHNVHAMLNNESLFSKAQPKDSVEHENQTLTTPGILKIGCDLHPWERAFIVVSDHPYFAATDEDGEFAIPDVPVGHYTLEAWHPRYGLRRFPVEVGDRTAKVTFTYASTDHEPDINKGELDGQF